MLVLQCTGPIGINIHMDHQASIKTYYIDNFSLFLIKMYLYPDFVGSCLLTARSNVKECFFL